MSIIDQKSCLLDDPQFEFIASERTFCAKADGEAGPCLGDSGSGFYVEHENVWFIEGITSSSLVRNNDCDVTRNAVFTSVSNFTDWINEKTGYKVNQNDLSLQSNFADSFKQIHLTTQQPTEKAPTIDDMWDKVKSIGKWIGWRLWFQ